MVKGNKKSITWSTSEIAGMVLAVIVLIGLIFAANAIYGVLMESVPSQDVVCVFNKVYLRLNGLNEVNYNCESAGKQANRFLILLINPKQESELINTYVLRNSENYQLCIYDKVRNQFEKCLTLDTTKLDYEYVNINKIQFLFSEIFGDYSVDTFGSLSEFQLNKDYSYEKITEQKTIYTCVSGVSACLNPPHSGRVVNSWKCTSSPCETCCEVKRY